MGCDIVMDPTNPYVYEFLTQFLQEAEGIFEEDIFFLGGDEVDSSCWEQNPAIAKWLTAHNMTASQLQQYFWQQVGSKVLPNINKTISIWEADALQIDPKSVPNGTIANVYQSLPTADKTVAAGMPTVVSIAGDHWYLDSECGGYNQNAWQCIYKVEPLSPYTKQHTDLFLGGETAMWGEVSVAYVRRRYAGGAAHVGCAGCALELTPLCVALLSMCVSTCVPGHQPPQL